MKAQFEKITESPKSSFKAHMNYETPFNSPWHFHPEYELTLITKSKGVRYVGDTISVFDSGDLILLAPNLPHCWRNTDIDEQGSEAMVIQWKEELFENHCTEKVEFLPINKLLQDATLGIKFGSTTVAQVQGLMKTLIGEDGLNRYILLLQILNILAHSLDRRLISNSALIASLNTITQKRVHTIQVFVETHFHRKIYLHEVADLTHMTEQAFCRFFKKVFHRTFFQYLNDFRIKIACKLLTKSNIQVLEVAYSSGFESLPFFYRQFGKQMGISPLRYRKSFGKNAYKSN